MIAIFKTQKKIKIYFFHYTLRNQMTVPTLEEVYKTMHLQLKILSKQRSSIEEIKARVAAERYKNKNAKVVLNNSSASILTSNNDSKR